jgi:hypothetical protein
MADIRIDRYEFDIVPGATTTRTITDVGDMSKAFVRMLGPSIKSSAGPLGNTSTNMAPNNMGVSAQLTDTTTITLKRDSAATGTIKVMVEVWSYQGVTSGDYEFIVRGRGVVSVTTGSNSAAVASITDRDKCIPIYQGWVSASTSNTDWEMITLACHVNASDEVVFTRNNSGTQVDGYYTVVEFIGISWNVGHAVSTSHNVIGTAGISLTMNTSSTGTGGSAFSVSNWNSAMILDGSMGGDSFENGLADCNVVFSAGGSATTINMHFADTNAQNDSVAYAHVLQAGNLVVNRIYDVNLDEGNGSFGTDITVSGTNSATPLSELSLEWFTSSSGTGTAWSRGCLHGQITAHNTIRHWVHRIGNTVFSDSAIVDFSAIISATIPGIKYWSGSAFETKPVKYWTGAVWEAKPFKHWDGTQWTI